MNVLKANRSPAFLLLSSSRLSRKVRVTVAWRHHAWTSGNLPGLEHFGQECLRHRGTIEVRSSPQEDSRVTQSVLTFKQKEDSVQAFRVSVRNRFGINYLRVGRGMFADSVEELDNQMSSLHILEQCLKGLGALGRKLQGLDISLEHYKEPNVWSLWRRPDAAYIDLDNGRLYLVADSATLEGQIRSLDLDLALRSKQAADFVEGESSRLLSEAAELLGVRRISASFLEGSDQAAAIWAQRMLSHRSEIEAALRFVPVGKFKALRIRIAEDKGWQYGQPLIRAGCPGALYGSPLLDHEALVAYLLSDAGAEAVDLALKEVEWEAQTEALKKRLTKVIRM